MGPNVRATNPGPDARHRTRPARSGSTPAGDPMSEVERRRRDAGIDILTGVDRLREARHVPETVQPRGREDGGEFRIVQERLLDRVPRNVRPEVLPVREMPEMRRDVVERCTCVAEPR